MSSLEVVGMGAMNLDQLYLVERILADGEIAVSDFASQAGGSAANTIFGLAKLGVKAGFVGAVGDDETGRKLVDDLVRCGIEVSRIRVKKGGQTRRCASVTSGAGEPGSPAPVARFLPNLYLPVIRLCRT